MSPALQAAAYRFCTVIVALLVAAAVWYLVPDPAIKAAASGLAVAAIFALEELVKHTGPVTPAPSATPASVTTVTTSTVTPARPVEPAPVEPPPPAEPVVPVEPLPLDPSPAIVQVPPEPPA
jgi:hypothetical protein